MIQNWKLSENFSLYEFLESDKAKEPPNLTEYQFNPPKLAVKSLAYLCKTALQPIRSALGYPISISSGYRCPELNSRVGSNSGSQHLLGEAADCIVKSKEDAINTIKQVLLLQIKKEFSEIKDIILKSNNNANFYLFAFVCMNLDKFDIDQVIHEYGTAGRPNWVHISSSNRKNARQILSIDSKGTRTLTIKEALMLGCEG